jgi:hypothetical protein
VTLFDIPALQLQFHLTSLGKTAVPTSQIVHGAEFAMPVVSASVFYIQIRLVDGKIHYSEQKRSQRHPGS